MSDVKHEETVDEVSVEKVEVVEESGRAVPVVSPVVFLLFMILVMVVVLVVVNVKRGSGAGNGDYADDPSVAALKADVEARRTELNRQRMAMGLPPLEGGSEPIGDIATRLKKDTDMLVGLAGRFQEMLAEKDSELSARNGEILRGEQLRQSLAAESARLQGELQRALVGGSEAEYLKSEVSNVKAQRDALAADLKLAKERLADLSDAVNPEQLADLERRYEEMKRTKEFYENRAKELEAELGSRNLFAESEDDLLPAAVALFRTLRKLEGVPDSELTTAYSTLGVDLGANVLMTLAFRTGSSEMTAEEEQAVRNLIDEMPDGDLALVVGYASKTGDALGNERLSSDRATAVAEMYAGAKRPGQKVQAVYLGQTDRFSGRTPERNQICEIWLIRAK